MKQNNPPQESHFHYPFWKSLHFRIPVVSIFLFTLLLFSLYLILILVTKPELEKKSNLLYQKSGEFVIAQIYQRTRTAENLARSIANAVSNLPKDGQLIQQIFPKMLNLDAEMNEYIAGGGVWPEPYQFDDKIQKRSFFWGKDSEGKLNYVDDYNSNDGAGYHHEEWYVPVKFLPKGEVYWSKSYVDPYTRQPMVTVSVPMYRNDLFFGVVTIDLKLGRLERLLSISSKVFDGYSFMLDRNQRFVSKPMIAHIENEKINSLNDLAQKIPIMFKVSQKIQELTLKKTHEFLNQFPKQKQIAHQIAKESYDINIDEAFYIASRFLIDEVSFGQLGIFSEDLNNLDPNNDFHLFEMPNLNWYFISVAPNSYKNTTFSHLISDLITYLSVVLLIIFSFSFLLLEYFLIKPLHHISSQLQQTHSTQVSSSFIQCDKQNEIGSIAFWHNDQIKQTQKLQNELSEKLVEITAQEKALRSSENRFRDIIETSKDWFWEINKKGVYTYVSPVITSVLGYSPEEVLGKTPFDFIPTHNKEEMTQVFNRYLNQNEAFSDLEKINIHKDGHEVIVSTSAVPIINRQGDFNGYRGVDHDITEKNAIELLEQEMAFAEQRNQARSEFLAMMSHELRTPIHGILSFSNLALSKAEGLSPEKSRRYFSNIHVSGTRLLHLINDLLDLSKLEAGKMQFHFTQASLLRIAENCIAEQQARLTELNKTVNWTQNDLFEEVDCDVVRIGQVITNFLSNAIKFTGENGHIDFSLTSASMLDINDNEISAIMFSTRDYGDGIPMNELESIFEKFVQSSTTKNNAGGTGLGLPICKEIISAHAGNIWAENHPQGGAVFRFVIPIKQVNIKNLG